MRRSKWFGQPLNRQHAQNEARKLRNKNARDARRTTKVKVFRERP